jgi:hypothetical protein
MPLIGYVCDNRYVDPRNIIQGELLLLNIINTNMSGSPVINDHGKLVGIMSNNPCIAYSEDYIKHPLRALILTYQQNTDHPSLEGFAFFNNTYYQYNHSYIGVNAILVQQTDFINLSNKNLTLEYNNIDNYYLSSDIIEKLELSKDFSEFSYNAENTYHINHIIEDEGDYYREIIGYKLTKIYNPELIACGLVEGDIITHINKIPLGDRKHQKSPSFIMITVKIYHTINIIYRKRSEAYLKNYQIEICALPHSSEYESFTI